MQIYYLQNFETCITSKDCDLTPPNTTGSSTWNNPCSTWRVAPCVAGLGFKSRGCRITVGWILASGEKNLRNALLGVRVKGCYYDHFWIHQSKWSFWYQMKAAIFLITPVKFYVYHVACKSYKRKRSFIWQCFWFYFCVLSYILNNLFECYIFSGQNQLHRPSW